jgi:hypothetical protein
MFIELGRRKASEEAEERGLRGAEGERRKTKRRMSSP